MSAQVGEDIDLVKSVFEHRLRQHDLDRILTALSVNDRDELITKVGDLLRHISALVDVSSKMGDSLSLDILLPHIVALPGTTLINVNTATGPVLQSLDERITVADAERLIAERADAGFSEIARSFGGLMDPDDISNKLSETTEFFQLRVIVRVDTVRITYFSILERGPRGDVTPILRSLGTT